MIEALLPPREATGQDSARQNDSSPGRNATAGSGGAGGALGAAASPGGGGSGGGGGGRQITGVLERIMRTASFAPASGIAAAAATSAPAEELSVHEVRRRTRFKLHPLCCRITSYFY